MSAWINVEAALPDDGEAVIIHTLGGEVWTGFIDGDVWRDVSGERIHDEEPVLHWRPLPDPPEEEENDVRRWNRVLSDEEIAALYKLGPTGVEVQPQQAGQL